MRFTKSENIYKITRITGNQDYILGICFDTKDSQEDTIQIIDLHFPNLDNTKVRTSHTELLTQILDGLNCLNQSLETNYTLSKIYYVPSLNESGIYRALIRTLIRHYHEGKEFEES